MSTDDLRKAQALKSFSEKTDSFLVDLMHDATARGFCHACALSFVATIVVAACEVLDHDREKLTDEMLPTDFDDRPGHA